MSPHSRRRGLRLALALAAVVPAGLTTAGALALRKPAPAAPLRTAFWYWHHPFRLTGEERQKLERLQMERLYVHAGTLALEKGRLVAGSRQQWLTEATPELHAVIRVHPAANSRFLSAGPEEIRRLLNSLRLPEGLHGIQWDADIPTARLPEYAAFLKRCRPALPAAATLGATALPDWLPSPAYPELCRALDEISPQFYGNHWPLPGKTPPPLWETRGLDRQLERAATGGIPVWAGVPSYGRVWVLDPGGRALGLRHDLDPDPLLADPAWELSSAATLRTSLGGRAEAPVEDSLRLTCRETATAGPIAAPAGTSLWFQWPRADALLAFVEALQRRRPADVAGVCYFRWPAPGEPLALQLPDPASPASPQVRITRTGDTVAVTVLPGQAPPPAETPVTLTVFPAGGELRSGHEVEWRQGDLPTSRLRADRARLRRPLLLPNRAWIACTIQSPRGPVTATLHPSAARPDASVPSTSIQSKDEKPAVAPPSLPQPLFPFASFRVFRGQSHSRPFTSIHG